MASYPYDIMDGKTVEEIIQFFQTHNKDNIVETHNSTFEIINLEELEDSFGF
jgi:hypothetical protein